MLATEIIQCNGSVSKLLGLPLLLLDVPVTNKAELAFIFAAAPEVLATIPAADGLTINLICKALFVQAEDLDHAQENEGIATAIGTLSSLQRRLFNEQQALPEATPDGAVEVFSAPDEGRECIRQTFSIRTFDRVLPMNFRAREGTLPMSFCASPCFGNQGSLGVGW